MEICEAHWDRRSERVRAYRNQLCKYCYRGAELYPNRKARPIREKVATLRGGYRVNRKPETEPLTELLTKFESRQQAIADQAESRFDGAREQERARRG